MYTKLSYFFGALSVCKVTSILLLS